MEEGLQRLDGAVARVAFYNPENGYCVFELAAGDELIAVAGRVGEVHVGENVTAYGRMGEHPVYGEQFNATACETSLPQDTRATLAYLSSGALPFIGPATARRLVQLYGDTALDVIANEPQKLCLLRGITPQKAEAIQKAFREMFGVREAVAWLGRFGIPAQKAVEAFKHFGPAVVEALSHNPYLLCGEPLQLSFAQADRIAAELQLAEDGSLRVQAALLYALRRNAGNGHTCLPRTRLIESTARFLSASPEAVAAGLEAALEEGELRSVSLGGAEFVCLPDLLAAEEEIAAHLIRLARQPAAAPRGLAGRIDTLERAQGFGYAPLQRRAIEMALCSNVLVLTGGPGTGKTTAVNAILALYENQADRVALCAPTGRAAKRLAELTGHKASTIHRLLEVDYTPGDGPLRFLHNEKNLLKCDVVVLDEMSMVDVRLFQSLLRALRPGCRVIMVGDADQLPSVGPGNVLGEIVRSGLLPTVRLTEIFRQAAASLIVANAHRIVEGKLPQKGAKTDDFFFLEAEGQACQQLVCDLVCTRLPQSYGFDPVRDIQVLCPTKLGPVGTAALNARLQERLNPPAPHKPQLEAAGRVFRVGDKVMQVRNNYDIPYERQGGESGVGAFNGDIGIVLAADADARTLTVQMDDRRLVYAGEHLQELEIAYAVTVHKSQGSEFAAVVLPVAGVPAKLCYRNLLYTGVTRARRLCILAGQPATVSGMIANVRQNLRYSALAVLMQREAEEKGKAKGLAHLSERPKE